MGGGLMGGRRATLPVQVGRAVARPLMALPVTLHRAGLGRLAPPATVLLEHRGRVSGRVRWTMLEAVGHADGVVTVVAGRGERADWVRNVRRDPRVRITVGRAPAVPARAEVLDAQDSRAPVAALLGTNPLGEVLLRRVLGPLVGVGPDSPAPPLLVRLVTVPDGADGPA